MESRGKNGKFETPPVAPPVEGFRSNKATICCTETARCLSDTIPPPPPQLTGTNINENANKKRTWTKLFQNWKSRGSLDPVIL